MVSDTSLHCLNNTYFIVFMTALSRHGSVPECLTGCNIPAKSTLPAESTHRGTPQSWSSLPIGTQGKSGMGGQHLHAIKPSQTGDLWTQPLVRLTYQSGLTQIWPSGQCEQTHGIFTQKNRPTLFPKVTTRPSFLTCMVIPVWFRLSSSIACS